MKARENCITMCTLHKTEIKWIDQDDEKSVACIKYWRNNKFTRIWVENSKERENLWERDLGVYGMLLSRVWLKYKV
jgi:hypothetical protein